MLGVGSYVCSNALQGQIAACKSRTAYISKQIVECHNLLVVYFDSTINLKIN